MSSDDYFDGDMDSAFLQQVDELEAAHTQKQQAPSRTLSAPGPSHQVIELDDSDEFDVFDIGEADIKAFDLTCSNVPSSSRPISNNTRLSRHSSMGTVQTTLFGGIVAQKPVSNTSNKLSSSTLSTRPPNSDRDRQRPKKTKQWDHTAFAKTGWKNPKPKGKGKQKGFENEEQEENEDWDSPTEFEQFPAPQVSVAYVSNSSSLYEPS